MPPLMVTDEHIRNLRYAAWAAGDCLQVDICDRALIADGMNQEGDAIALADWNQDDARAECARVIAEMADSDNSNHP